MTLRHLSELLNSEGEVHLCIQPPDGEMKYPNWLWNVIKRNPQRLQLVNSAKLTYPATAIIKDSDTTPLRVATTLQSNFNKWFDLKPTTTYRNNENSAKKDMSLELNCRHGSRTLFKWILRTQANPQSNWAAVCLITRLLYLRSVKAYPKWWKELFWKSSVREGGQCLVLGHANWLQLHPTCGEWDSSLESEIF